MPFHDQTDVTVQLSTIINFTHIYQMKASHISQAATFYRKNGYAIISNFISSQKCDLAVAEINRMIDSVDLDIQEREMFDASQTGHQQMKLGKYFQESAKRISFFYQNEAKKNGKLVVPKRHAINRIGHTFHQHNELFKSITYGEGVWDLCQQLNITDPTVPASLAVLKPPIIGSQLRIHQDSTYLLNDPDTLVTFWVPLQDSTINNGCVWGLPGSHNYKLYKRYLVQQDRSEQTLQDHPVDYKQDDFIPLEMKKGQLLIFGGKFLHKSHRNLSDISRYAYIWNIVDRKSKWEPLNWIKRQSFPDFPQQNKTRLL